MSIFSGFFGSKKSTVANPSKRFLASISRGSRASSGVNVTADTAMAFSAFFAGVRLLSETKGQLAPVLYRKTVKKGSEDGRVKAKDHPVYDLIKHAPNNWQTAVEYQELKQASMVITGNSVSYKETDQNGIIQQLIPCDSSKITVYQDENRRPVYDLPDIGLKRVPMSQVHHVRAFGTNGYWGASPIEMGKNSIGLAMVTEEHAAKVFSNGTNLSGWIERPKDEAIKELNQKQLDHLKNQWRKEYSGRKNVGSVAILQEGMKYHGMSMSNSDAELIASMNYSVNAICRILNIPPHMLQLLDRATHNNIEHQNLTFIMYTMMPWIKRDESAMMRDLLTKKDRADGYYIEFNVSAFMRGDMQSRYESYSKGRQWGWLSVNDIRRFENLPPIKGGDVYLQPLNMIDANNKPIESSKYSKERAEVRRELDQIKQAKETSE